MKNIIASQITQRWQFYKIMPYNQGLNGKLRRYAAPLPLAQRYDLRGFIMVGRIIFISVLSVILVSCSSTHGPIGFQSTKGISKDTYNSNNDTHGTVLFDVNWGRRWPCGSYENAQLVSLTFDKLPLQSVNDETLPNLVVQTPGLLRVHPVFLNYAYSLPAGTYGISGVSIKAAKSVSNVGYFALKRSDLFKEKEPTGGTFKVSTGEVVFIGNFFLDCALGSPTLWRYYPDTHNNFERQVKEYKNTFPYLDVSNVKYRLFKTKEFGYDFSLSAE